MKTCYIEIEEGTHNCCIADTVDAREFLPVKGRVITRINTSAPIRNQGYAKKVMAQILRDADEEGITLALEVQPSDGTDYDRLVEWYRSLGFRWHKTLPYMVRKAR